MAVLINSKKIIKGRWKLAEAFNEAVAKGELSAPIILSRDHHDVSGIICMRGSCDSVSRN